MCVYILSQAGSRLVCQSTLWLSSRWIGLRYLRLPLELNWLCIYSHTQFIACEDDVSFDVDDIIENVEQVCSDMQYVCNYTPANIQLSHCTCFPCLGVWRMVDWRGQWRTRPLPSQSRWTHLNTDQNLLLCSHCSCFHVEILFQKRQLWCTWSHVNSLSWFCKCLQSCDKILLFLESVCSSLYLFLCSCILVSHNLHQHFEFRCV